MTLFHKALVHQNNVESEVISLGREDGAYGNTLIERRGSGASKSSNKIIPNSVETQASLTKSLGRSRSSSKCCSKSGFEVRFCAMLN